MRSFDCNKPLSLKYVIGFAHQLNKQFHRILVYITSDVFLTMIVSFHAFHIFHHSLIRISNLA